MVYSDAYAILQNIDACETISEDFFNRLQIQIRNNYLEAKDYHNRLEIHRHPIELKNEILNDLRTYFQEIQNRADMRDINEERKISGYVPTKVGDIWRADKRLRSLYNAVKAYCELRSKDFNTIAVHIAEYRSLTKMYWNIDRNANRKPLLARSAQPTKPAPVRDAAQDRNMHITNAAKFIAAMKKIECGEAHVAEFTRDDFEIRPYLSKPIEGYKAPENFPNCCNYHKSIYQGAVAAFERFPDCCEGHKNLKQATWFAKKNYTGMPERVLNALSFTEHHLIAKIDNEDWYEDITHYLDYTLHSFGQFPTGYGSPLGIGMYSDNLVGYIESQTELEQEKKTRLVAFIKDYGQPGPEIHTDLNLLISTYKKWVSIFPFQLTHLAPLKDHFEKTMPLIASKPVLNPYTGLSAAKILTLSELFAWLVKATNTILMELNAMKLYEQGKITEVSKAKLEYLNAARKFELDELAVTRLSDRPEYIRMLKRWFAGEKKYLKELGEILDAKPQVKTESVPEAKPVTAETNSDTNVFCQRMPIQVARDHFYVLVTNNSKNGKPYLSEEAFSQFIRKAILGEKGIGKLKLNVGPREKYFVVKRFFEFYQLAVRELYEEYAQCKLKYVKFLTDNFDNWKQSDIEPNFATRTSRNW